jgi:hypothetical protein
MSGQSGNLEDAGDRAWLTGWMKDRAPMFYVIKRDELQGMHFVVGNDNTLYLSPRAFANGLTYMRKNGIDVAERERLFRERN